MPTELPESTIELWGLAGYGIIGLITAIATAWATSRFARGKVATIGKDVAALGKQVSNGQTTLMRDDLMATKRAAESTSEAVIGITASLGSLTRVVEQMQRQQIRTAGEIGGVRAQIGGLSEDVQALEKHVQGCPIRNVA